MVADGGDGPLEAVIEEIRTDGTIVLSVLAYGPSRPLTPAPTEAVSG